MLPQNDNNGKLHPVTYVRLFFKFGQVCTVNMKSSVSTEGGKVKENVLCVGMCV